MSIRSLLRLIRAEIAGRGARNADGSRSPWVAERLTWETKDLCAEHDVEIRNRPDVGGGFLCGLGQYRVGDGAWRDL